MIAMDIRDFLLAQASELRDTAQLHEVAGQMPKALAEGMASPAALFAEAEKLEATATGHVMRSSMVDATYQGPPRMICAVDHQQQDPCTELRKAAWAYRDDPRFDDGWTPNSRPEA